MTENQELRRNWGWFFALGLLFFVAGGTAWLSPFIAGLFVETAIGFAFLIGGALGLVQVFMTKDGWDARMTYLILGGFNVLAGLALLFRPLEGMLALTLVVIVAFFVSGLIRLAMGIMARPATGWSWMVFAGVLSVLLSGYLMTRYPEISAELIGIIAGCLFVSEGASYVRFAYGLKNNVSMDL